MNDSVPRVEHFISTNLKYASIVEKLERGAGASLTDKIADSRKGEGGTLIVTRKGR